VAVGPLCQQSPLTHLLPWTGGEVAIVPPADAGGSSSANSNGPSGPVARPPPPGHGTHPPNHGGSNGNGSPNGNGTGNQGSSP
jgi:hypothetical protein